MARSHRQNVKSRHLGDWRDQIRSECLGRVQEQRAKLLDGFRGRSRTPEAVKASLSSILADVTSVHSENISPPDQPADRSLQGLSLIEQGTPLGNLHAHSSSFITPKLQRTLMPNQLSREEYDALMMEMEAALFEEASQEELQAFEASECDEVSEAFLAHCRACSLAESRRCPDGQIQVLCPVCRDGYLVESAGSVSCMKEGFCVDVPMNGSASSTLATLGDRLAELLVQHNLSGCYESPRFLVTDQGTGIWTLFMACEGCNTLEAVL